ncbi:CocE/NonD family hydrolase [Haloarchaeobius sp. TZWWS8]|uniref:CocE/NonD family hydrolase n=1 Tax=Haloarchaeobius sp. TZWWS8 TaxID=3446121 RepID=UPI003EBCA5AA
MAMRNSASGADDSDNNEWTRRRLLRNGGFAGLGLLVGTGTAGSATASAGTAGSSAGEEYGYRTTTGVTEPRYQKGTPTEHYVETEYTIDGASESPTIYGQVIRPVDENGDPVKDVPVILTYSPYNDVRCPQGEACAAANDGVADFFVPRGYARATFDVVGTRNSDGCYDYGGHRERKTGAQLVDYLGSRDWSNGKVGMIGGSYDGTTQLAAAIEDPEHLEAIVPQVAIDRWYDYAFGGGIRYFLNNEYPTDEGFDTPFAFDFGFGLLPPMNVDEPWQYIDDLDDRFRPCDAVEHTERAYEYDPVYDGFWEERDYRRAAAGVSAAVLVEGGWLDHNVKHWDSTRFYEALPDDHPKKLVMGQWNHQASGFADAQAIRHAWFDHWLLGLDTGVMDLPAVDTQTSTGERVQYADWPPAGTEEKTWVLVGSANAAGEGSGDSRELVLQGTTDPSYTDTEPPLTEEEMFATAGSGPNHLEFLSEPVDDPVRITGSPLLSLVATSTEASTHYTPVIFDEAPDGSREVVTRGFLNARNRNGLDVSEPVPTAREYTAPVDCWDVDWLLPAGHRLGIVVASDNRDWALNDPDGHSTNTLVLGDDGAGSTLTLPTGPTTLDVSGTRRDDGSVFTGGQTDHVQLTAEANQPVALRDRVPSEWTVLTDLSDDVERVEQPTAGGSQFVYFGVDPATEQSVEYFVEAPSGTERTGDYDFGPAEAIRTVDSSWVAVPETDDQNTVVGEDTNT